MYLLKGRPMDKDAVRAHIVLPRAVVAAVDRLVGQRRRSQFMAEAIAEKLRRENLRAALRETAGSLDLAHYPQWATPEQVSAWVRASRAQDDAATDRKLHGSASG